MSLFHRRHILGLAAGLLLAVVSAPAVAQMTWVKSYEEALKQAAKEKKFVVLDISASW
jgi:hypothetical protein